MTWLEFFGRGVIIGVAIAAPVGPIGVLCIRRTLLHGRAAGFVSGLGAAAADGIYGSIAVLGLTAATRLLASVNWIMQIAGGAFLCFLGMRSIFKASNLSINPAGDTGGGPLRKRVPGALFGDFATTFILTLTNPLTILAFAAIIAGAGFSSARPGGAQTGWLLIAGVFTGSAGWWFFLSAAVAAVKTRFFQPGWTVWVGRISGGILMTFGVAALITALVGA